MRIIHIITVADIFTGFSKKEPSCLQEAIAVLIGKENMPVF